MPDEAGVGDWMRPLAVRLLVAVAVFGLINLWAYTASGFFAKQREYQGEIDALWDRPSVKTLILGDSHPMTLEHSFLADDVYNLSKGGDGLKESYLKLRHALSRPNEIEHLLLTADAHMLGASRIRSANQTYLYPYALELGAFDVYDASGLAMLFESWVPLANDRFVEFLKKRAAQRLSGEYKRVQLADRLRADHALWSEGIPDEKRREYARRTGVSDHRGVLEREEQLDRYRSIVALAKANGIRVIGVRFPAMEEYIAGLPGDREDAYRQFLATVPFDLLLDYRHFTQDPRLFRNEDHLNRTGARLLMRRIEADADLKLGTEQRS